MGLKSQPFKKGFGRCAFCEQGGKGSREHIWPKWAHPYLPNVPHSHIRQRTKGPLILEEWQREGPPSSITVAAVCQDCNNGWMSRMEAAAKPWLLPILQRQPISFDAIAQNCLARYFVMKSMVADLSRNAEVVFIQTERTAFFKSRAIPAELYVVLYHYPEPVNKAAQYNKETLRQRSGLATSVAKNDSRSGNFTFRFGSAFMQILFLRKLKGEFIRDAKPTIKLHPSAGTTVNWPPSTALNIQEAHALQHILEIRSRQWGVRFAE